MNIAVVNEISTADRNTDIVASLQDRGHEILNVGMKHSSQPPELTVIHTSFLSALLLATGRADLIVAGCGTGQGFEIAVTQYPGVYCGHIQTPLDAWLFQQINGGNVISLALNQGYGWAADQNLRMIFDAFFSVEAGGGYPAHRRPTQQESRRLLHSISDSTHRAMADIVRSLPERVVDPAITYPGIWDVLDCDSLADLELADVLRDRYAAARAGLVTQQA